MRLVFRCKSCSHTNKINKFANDRVELSKQTGHKFSKTCNNCGKKNMYNVNNVYAEKGNLNIIFLISTLIIMLLLFKFLNPYLDSNQHIHGSYLLVVGIAIPPIIYFVWLQTQEKNIRSFNKYKVK